MPPCRSEYQPRENQLRALRVLTIYLPPNLTEQGTNDKGETARLFVALWPEPALASALHAQCSVCIGSPHTRVVAPQRAHLTLRLLGQVPRQQVPALVSALRVPFQPFELSFSRCEQWPHGLLVAVPDTVAPSLTHLHAALDEVQQGLGLPVDERQFRPHLTLARRHMKPLPELARQPLRRPVAGYALVQSQAAPRRGVPRGAGLRLSLK